MIHRYTLPLVPALLVAGIVASAGEPSSDDDLALVKRATSTFQERRSTGTPARAVTSRKAPRRPEWLKLRIVEKGAKGARISVSLPFALVRAVGDWPFEEHCRRLERAGSCSIRLSRALRALDAGEELVQIEGEDATVRVWVE